MILTQLEAALVPVVGASVAVRFHSGKARRFGDVGIATHQAITEHGPEIVDRIIEALQDLPEVRSAEATGQFVNVVLDRPAVVAAIVGAPVAPEPTGQPAVLMEHTSINPNAEPHVGRARNAIVGDALRRIFQATGHTVDVHYLVNDFGKQIALLHIAFGGAIPPETAFPEVLRRYVEINQQAEADPALDQQAQDLLAAAESGDDVALSELQAIARHCLEGQVAILARLDISYDTYDFETQFLESERLQGIEQALWDKGVLFIDDDERTTADLERLGWARDEGRFFVLRRSNGSSMYGLRDLAYNSVKAELAQPGRNVVVLGEDHKLYQEQLEIMLRAIGIEPPEAVYYSFITLRDGKMSTRKGTVVMLSDLITQAQDAAFARIREASPDWTDDDVRVVANQVAVAAVRFTILKTSLESQISFDLDEALKFEGSTGPYVQYTVVRCGSIALRAAGLPVAPAATEISEAAWELVLCLDEYEYALSSSAELLSPHRMCDYLLRLARQFNKLYHEERVVTDGQVNAALLALVARTRAVLAVGLETLGIPVPERM